MASVASSAIASSSAKSQANQQYSNDMQAAQMQREWQLEDRDESREYSRDYLKNLVTDAGEAGFNPLSILRSGGGGNYNAAAAHAPLSAPHVPSKQATSSNILGGAVQSIGDFMRDFDPHADTKREKEYELVNAQIRQLNTQSDYNAGQTFNAKVRAAGQIAPKTNTAKLSKGAEVQDMYVPYRDLNGKVHYLPNPDLPDLDQMAVPSVGVVANESVTALNNVAKTVSSWPVFKDNSIKPKGTARPRNRGVTYN